ncbi:hypothetical protein N0V88_003240 [Collariella sp. IMI 366227]|nr:hypothetical protein N0V88_003240 [Collariella sp. IMI 366227]
MAPPFDPFQQGTAITAGALPLLEILAANGDGLERALDRRFQRDDPPYLSSSSESETDAARFHPLLARPRDIVFQEHKPLLDRPFDKWEFDNALFALNDSNLYSPGKRYENEARHELGLLRQFCWDNPRHPELRRVLDHKTGDQRAAVITRRNIRKRWERLGVWNPEWGIPGRVQPQPEDDPDTWKWEWQSNTDSLPSKHPEHPITKAVQERRNRSLAESFITSRPWFVLAVDIAEFNERCSRLPVGLLPSLASGEDTTITKWWKERGDWDEGWKTFIGHPVPGWKWRHESPAPEPEDLECLKNGISSMDFTPSEADALDAIVEPAKSSPSPTPEPSSPPPRPVRLFGNTYVNGIPVDKEDEPETQLILEAEEQQDDAAASADEKQTMNNLSPSPPPRRRGRSRKINQLENLTTTLPAPTIPRRTRAVPAAPPSPPPTTTTPKKRGRPRKAVLDSGIIKPVTSPPPAKREWKPYSQKTTATAITMASNAQTQQQPVAMAAADNTAIPQKKKRGRSRKEVASAAPPAAKALMPGTASTGAPEKKKRGQPRKVVVGDGGVAKPVAAAPARVAGRRASARIAAVMENAAARDLAVVGGGGGGVEEGGEKGVEKEGTVEVKRGGGGEGVGKCEDMGF